MAGFTGTLVVPKLASAPSSPAEGQVYYNTSDQKLYIRAASTWVDLTATGGASSTSFLSSFKWGD